MINGKISKNTADSIAYIMGIVIAVLSLILIFTIGINFKKIDRIRVMSQRAKMLEKDLSVNMNLNILGLHALEDYARLRIEMEDFSDEYLEDKNAAEYTAAFNRVLDNAIASNTSNDALSNLISCIKSCDDAEKNLVLFNDEMIEALWKRIIFQSVILLMLIIAMVVIFGKRIYAIKGWREINLVIYENGLKSLSVDNNKFLNYIDFLKLMNGRSVIVDVEKTREYIINDKGKLEATKNTCFCFWDKDRRCENCIALKCLENKGISHKFEIKGETLYISMARYLEIDNRPYVLEISQILTDKLIDKFPDKNKTLFPLVQAASEYYIDPVSKAYSRKFMEEQLFNLRKVEAIAAVGVDNYDEIISRFDKWTADEVLEKVVAEINSHLGLGDAVARIEKNKFVIIFAIAPESALEEMLETIRKSVEDAVLEDNEQVEFTVSIGAILTNSIDKAEVKKAVRVLMKNAVNKNIVVIGEKE